MKYITAVAGSPATETFIYDQRMSKPMPTWWYKEESS